MMASYGQRHHMMSKGDLAPANSKMLLIKYHSNTPVDLMCCLVTLRSLSHFARRNTSLLLFVHQISYMIHRHDCS